MDHLLEAFVSRPSGNGRRRNYSSSARATTNRGWNQLRKSSEYRGPTTFTGFVSEEEKVKYLNEMHVAVNTSAKEGWGLTAIEANACGTPTVSSNVQGLRDAVVDGETGLLYEYGNREQLAEKILLDASRRPFAPTPRRKCVAAFNAIRLECCSGTNNGSHRPRSIFEHRRQ